MYLTREYDRARALAYAARWWNGRNPLFYNFTGIGGDCTNFVSQCVLAGSCRMNFTPVFGWYYRTVEDRAPAWTGVEAFWKFMTGANDFAAVNGGTGPFGREVPLSETERGDVAQFGDEAGDFYHTVLITDYEEDGAPLCTCHSNDAYNKPLSAYDYAVVRFLHIEGVRLAATEPSACFEPLLEGTALLF